MKRSIIEINETLCNGCGVCITACAEGALEIIGGKARLVSDVYCDGLGACLSGCPTGALQVIERDAPEFSEEAVKARVAGAGEKKHHHHDKHHDHHHDHQGHHGHHHEGEKSAKGVKGDEPLACGCPGSMATVLKRPVAHGCPGAAAMTLKGGAVTGAAGAGAAAPAVSELTHWPIKLELVRPDAPFLRGADLVLLADCAGVSAPDLHPRFLKGNAVVTACPKFTDLDLTIGRLAAVIRDGGIGSLTVVHMEVPCCRGLVVAAERALERSGADIGLKRVNVGRDGKVQEEEMLHTPAGKVASK